MSNAAFWILVILLIQPVIWYALGYRPVEFENRPLTKKPKIDVTRLSDPKFYDELNLFIADLNPLKWYAVVAQSRLRYNIFGTVYQPSVSQSVRVGRDGWL